MKRKTKPAIPMARLPSRPRRQPATAMERKSINDAVAYIRGLAELRERNADWAERAVREAASLSAEEAVAQQVVDLVADSVRRLLKAIDQRRGENRRGRTDPGD